MAVIYDPIIVDQAYAMPSLGSLLGTHIGFDVFDKMNVQGFKSFFGSDFDDMRARYIREEVLPADQLSVNISGMVATVMNHDVIRPLLSIEDFQAIPPVMEMAICLFDPVRKGILEGRMEGFGYDPDSLPEEDYFGRMIDNFSCDDVLAACDNEGYFDLEGTMLSTDPDLSDDQLWAIRKTRQYIQNHILDKTDRDPTAIDLPRG